MKKLKVILPMLAILFAIGLSFATVRLDLDPENDYIRQGSFWQAIPEVTCNPLDDACLVQLQPNGQVYQVFDAPDPNTAKEGDGTVIILY